MEYIINEIKLGICENSSKIVEKIAKKLQIDAKNIKILKIIKKSIDSRKKNNVCFSYNILFDISNNVKFDKKLVRENNLVFDINIPKVNGNFVSPIIVGSGPSGLFAGLTLAKMGIKPIILEQGKKASDRARDVETFWNGGEINIKSNVQFGHGGAGTFSDGKLNTGVNSPLVNYVLSEFARFGGDEEILYSNTPHIGTDVLVDIIDKMKDEIISLGGQVLFEHTFVGYKMKEKKIFSAVVEKEGKIFEIETDKIILCIGHSSRKTFEMLNKNGVFMTPKPFSIGLRIQHLQKTISENQYGEFAKFLPPADYKLSTFLENGRCVYTFCNCPGGWVVNASSEEGGVVCNGMSYHDRSSENANSAVLVNVRIEDFENDSPLAGVEFQRKWERSAFEIANGHNLPIQTLGDFINNTISEKIGKIKPLCKGKTIFADLNKCLPEFASQSIKLAVKEFDKKIRGFADKDAILVGVETRSSSPVRIVRNENFETNVKGLYSCGEGAGYAGGITSSCIDGIKLALKIYQ